MQAVAPLPLDTPLVLVAHSGAGVLLPAIGEANRGRVAGYIFVDAIVPEDGASRLDLFSSPEEVSRFREAAAGGLLPTWSADDLQEVIPNGDIRRDFAAELEPLPLAVYEEPIRVFEGWPDAPCGFLSFSRSTAYDDAIVLAKGRGWAYTELDGAHFHMLVDPAAVAGALLHLASRMCGC
jgi:hypothetical protein